MFEFLLELLLVEHLPARHPVDPGAHFGKPILVSKLHRRLARHHAGENVILECEVGRGHRGPPGHNHQRADHGPERHRPEPHQAVAVAESEGACGRPAITGARLRFGCVIDPLTLGSGAMLVVRMGRIADVTALVTGVVLLGVLVAV